MQVARVMADQEIVLPVWPLASGQRSDVVEPGETEACAASRTKLFGETAS